MINYNLSSVMMPLLLAGTQLGVILSRFLPAMAITFMLVFYLMSSAKKMYYRANKDKAQEEDDLMKQRYIDSDSLHYSTTQRLNQS